jgi:ATP-dependent DNA helicase RecQ
VHLIDVLRGKLTDKVTQYGHRRLSTFGVGADLSEMQWRAVLRQLIALGHLRVEGEFSTLELAESARAVLRGEVRLLLRQPAKPSGGRRRDKDRREAVEARGKAGRAPSSMGAPETARFEALKAWRAAVARERNVPAYVVFHDSSLAEMAREAPATLAALGGISGVGAKKLEAYGHDILKVLAEME